MLAICPRGQARQRLLPAAEIVPALQARHVPVTGSGTCPAMQNVPQLAIPVKELVEPTDPDGHVPHCEPPDTEEKVAGGHGTQAVAPDDGA